MLNKDYTAKLLDLVDVIITKVENFSEEVHVYLELPRIKHRCPACGALTDRVHDYRMQIIKDVPLGRTTLLHLRKRRYRCDCGKRFFEKNTFLPRYYRSTSRLVAKIITAFHETVSASKIGTQFNVSGATAMRYFKYVSFRPTKLPEVLSIDEFKGNSGGQKYNSIIVDAEKHKVIDILPNRFENDLIRYFSQYKSPEACLLWYAEFLQFQKKNPFLSYVKVMPERFSPAQPNYLRFVSTPTIDIEPFFYAWEELYDHQRRRKEPLPQRSSNRSRQEALVYGLIDKILKRR